MCLASSYWQANGDICLQVTGADIVCNLLPPQYNLGKNNTRTSTIICKATDTSIFVSNSTTDTLQAERWYSISY